MRNRTSVDHTTFRPAFCGSRSRARHNVRAVSDSREAELRRTARPARVQALTVAKHRPTGERQEGSEGHGQVRRQPSPAPMPRRWRPSH